MARRDKYDDGGWHRGNGFPEDYDSVHIALFVKWCFSKGWADPGFWGDSAADIQKMLDGGMSAVAFFENQCDDKFFPEMLTEEGNEFVETYYNDGYTTDFFNIESLARTSVSPQVAPDDGNSPANDAGDEATEELDRDIDDGLEDEAIAPEEAIDYEKFSALMDQRLAEFQAAQAERKNRPWYKFW